MSYEPKTLEELEQLIRDYYADAGGAVEGVGVRRTDEGWVCTYAGGHESAPQPTFRDALWALVEGTTEDEEAFRRIVGGME